MTTVTRLEAQQQLPDWQTFLLRGFFVVGLITAAIACWQAERSLHGQIRFDIAFLWLFCALGGAIAWTGYKRNQMTKQISDMLLLMLGFILMSAVHLVFKLADYASSAAQGLK